MQAHSMEAYCRSVTAQTYINALQAGATVPTGYVLQPAGAILRCIGLKVREHLFSCPWVSLSCPAGFAQTSANYLAGTSLSGSRLGRQERGQDGGSGAATTFAPQFSFLFLQSPPCSSPTK